MHFGSADLDKIFRKLECFLVLYRLRVIKRRYHACHGLTTLVAKELGVSPRWVKLRSASQFIQNYLASGDYWLDYCRAKKKFPRLARRLERV